MKKNLFSWIVFLLLAIKVSAQPPVAAPAPPSRNASDVVSLFSDSYTNVAGTDWFPNWGQSTVVSDILVGGNVTKEYLNLNYQGVQFASPVDAASMVNLHLDIWTPNCTAFDVFLINTSPGLVEQAYTINPTASGWNSIDIPLSHYNTIALNNIGQIKLTGLPWGTSTVYLDNFYFWKSANTPTLSNFNIPAKLLGNPAFTLTAPTSNSGGSFSYSSGNTNVATISGSTVTIVGVGTSIITATQAPFGIYGSGSITAPLVVSFAPPTTAAPTPPVRNANDVVSLYSDAYTNVAGTDWFPNWGQSTIVSDVTVAGNNTKKYENLNYQGVQFAGPVNASNMTNLHIDIWTPNCTAFDVFLINTSPGVTEQAYTINPTQSGWNSINILLTNYNTINLASINQIKLVGTPFGSSTVYIDNFYFWKSANTPTLSNFNVPAKVLGNPPFTLTAPTTNSGGSFSYTSSNTNVATISGNTVTVVGGGTSTITATQAPFGSYGSASITASLVVSFPPPSTAAPTPPVRNTTDVISLYSGAYTEVAGTDWFPNWGQSTYVSDIMIAGNSTKKYDNLNYQGVQFAAPINASAMVNLHVDIWTPNCDAFDIFLVNTSPSTVEQSVTLTPTKLGWNSYDIALSQYNTIALNNIGQFKLVGTPFGGSIVYLDNIYFWKGVAAPSLDVTQTTCSVATGTITVTSPTAGLAFSLNGGSFSNSTGIFSGLVAGTYTVRSKTSTGPISATATAVINPQQIIPLAPSPIMGVKNVNQCSAVQTYSVMNENDITYSWTVSGVGNSVQSGQGSNAVTLNLVAAGTITVKGKNSCNNTGPTTTFAVTKSIPTTPGYIYKAFLPSLVSAATNVCSYTASVVASTGVRDTFRIKQVAFATGYIWEAPGGSFVTLVNDTTIAVTFPDTITLSSTSPRYIKVYSLSACDTSLPRVLTLTRTLPTAPGVIQSSFSPSVAAVTEVCSSIGGSPITYRIRKAANATSYNWSLKVGSNATLVHLNGFGVNDTAVTVVYNTGFTKDTISVKSVNGCSVSLAKTLAVSAIMAPPAATNITSSTGNFNACAGNSVQYTVVAPAPTATQGTVMVYRWTIPAKTSITSANADSSVITLNFQTSFAGGSLSVKALSGCGIYSASKVASFIPPTPTGITSSTASYNACIGNVIQYTVVPTAATPLKATTHHYRWTIPAKTMISATNADSSVISVTFLSLYTGGNLTVKGVTVCGVAGSAKSQPLTHTGCPSGTRESIVKAQEITLNKAQLYPNPNNGTFNLNIETGINTTMPASVQIVDAFGRRVAQYNTMNTAGKMNKNIAENALAPGLYTVVYTIGSKTGSIKMVVNQR